jgi:hypothetical protein
LDREKGGRAKRLRKRQDKHRGREKGRWREKKKIQTPRGFVCVCVWGGVGAANFIDGIQESREGSLGPSCYGGLGWIL